MIATASPIATSLNLTDAISKCRTVEEIYEAALDALGAGLGVERASILLFDLMASCGSRPIVVFQPPTGGPSKATRHGGPTVRPPADLGLRRC